jgi:hypothetical protein
MSSATVRFPDTQQAKSLTDALQTKLQNPATSPEFDFQGAVEQVLADVGLTARDSGGKLSFYGQDPIVPSSFKFGAMAAVGLAARSVALAALWKSQTGSTDEHTYVAPDLFTAETPLGTYQGFTDQVVLSRTPGGFRTVLVPRGSSKPEWLA